MQIISFLPDLCMRSTTYFLQFTSGTCTAGTVKNNLKGTIKIFVSSENAISFMSSVKRKSACWEQFLYDALATVKQLGIPDYFLTLSGADQRW